VPGPVFSISAGPDAGKRDCRGAQRGDRELRGVSRCVVLRKLEALFCCAIVALFFVASATCAAAAAVRRSSARGVACVIDYTEPAPLEARLAGIRLKRAPR